MSLDLLITAIEAKKNPTVVGLDPKLDYIPEAILAHCRAEESFEGAAAAIFAFNCGLIDTFCDIVPAIKLQSAYYEMYGWQGMRTLKQTIDYAKGKGLYVIADAKRNDIGPTAEAYAAAWLGETDGLGAAFGADALTVNGYLGTDGLRPFASVCKRNGKGMFVLCKTSNPSAGELQDKTVDGRPVYEMMGEVCEQLGADTVGGVAIPQLARWWVQPIQNNWQNCAQNCRTHFFWCLVMAPKAEGQRTWQEHLMRTGVAPL